MFSLNKLKLLFRFLLLDNFFLGNRIQALKKNENLNCQEMQNLQNEMIFKTLKLALKKIPAYKRLILPSDSSSVRDFLNENVPVITKNDLLSKRHLFYPNGGKKSLFQIVGKTSGTTGTPLEVFRSYNSILWENAFVKRHWKNICSSELPIRRVTLRGNQVLSGANHTGTFWLYNDVDNQLILSSKHLNKENCNEFVEIINKYKPTMLQAYPSMAFQLAKYAQDEGLDIRVPFVFTASEMLYEYQREVIENTIGKVFDFYGMAERVAFATECQFNNLHVNTDYSYVEILDDNNRPTDEEGFIVGTTLHNHVMPLIRYKLSDRSKWKKGNCACGSNYPMIEKVSGKFEDTIYDIENTPISPSIITFAFKGVRNIVKSQVVQTARDRWTVKIVPAVDYVESDGQHIIKNLLELVSSKINPEIVLVDDIPSTAAGKYRWVLNEMKKNKDNSVEPVL